MEKEKVGHRVLKVRKHYKLSQQAFGAKLGVNNTAISKIEKGENNLTEQMLLAICREFRVNEDWLRTGEGRDDNMLELYNSENLKALAKEYSLDPLSKSILQVYVDLEKPERNNINEFIKKLSRQVLDGDIQRVKGAFVNELLHTDLYIDDKKTLNENFDIAKESLSDRYIGEIDAIFPPSKNVSPPPREGKPSLAQLRNLGNDEMVATSESEKQSRIDHFEKERQRAINIINSQHDIDNLYNMNIKKDKLS